MKYWWCYLRMKFAALATRLNFEFDVRISRRRFYLINLIFTQETIFWKIVRTSFISYKIMNWISNFLRKRITIIIINEKITKKININVDIFQKSSFFSIFYLFYNANFLKIKKLKTKRKKNFVLYKSNYIDDIMLTITKINSKITNVIIAKTHEKCQN